MLTTSRFTHRYLPATQPGPVEKVMVVFHGLGDSLDGYAWMPSELRLPQLSYLLVNAPDDYYGGYSWFDLTGGGVFLGGALQGILRSRGLVLGLIEELIAQGIAPGDILLFGFSQGCLVAIDAGLRTEHVLGGVCGVSGWIAFMEEYPKNFSAVAKRQKFLVTHGLQDPILPFERTAEQCRELSGMGLDLAFQAYPKVHTIVPEELAFIRNWIKDRISG